MKRALATVLFLAWTPALGLAQERAVALDAPLEASLGDAIDVIVTVTAAGSDEAAVPEQPFEPFEILAKKMSVSPSSDGTTKTFSFELQLICFETGVQELGPIQVRVTSADGELLELTSNTSSIEIRSLLANEPDPQLQPPSQPLLVEQDDYRLLIALGALLAIALGALLAWLFMRWWQKRDRPEPAPPPPPPPWETAFAELRELQIERASAIAEGRTEPWVDAVSDSIRAYLGHRYGFHGLESTTDEIAGQLGKATSLSVAPEDVVGFLAQCDLVKFARASLADEASQSLIEEALTLVERTRPLTSGDEGEAS